MKLCVLCNAVDVGGCQILRNFEGVRCNVISGYEGVGGCFQKKALHNKLLTTSCLYKSAGLTFVALWHM